MGVWKKIRRLATVIVMICAFPSIATADTHIVEEDETLWKIAKKYQMPMSEIFRANPQFENPNLIYPGDEVNIPNQDPYRAISREVIRLTNEKRREVGLSPLADSWGLFKSEPSGSEAVVRHHYFEYSASIY